MDQIIFDKSEINVVVKGEMSLWTDVKSGMPQGPVLGQWSRKLILC